LIEAQDSLKIRAWKCKRLSQTCQVLDGHDANRGRLALSAELHRFGVVGLSWGGEPPRFHKDKMLPSPASSAVLPPAIFVYRYGDLEYLLVSLRFLWYNVK
jgi:hypothetical protein